MRVNEAAGGNPFSLAGQRLTRIVFFSASAGSFHDGWYSRKQDVEIKPEAAVGDVAEIQCPLDVEIAITPGRNLPKARKPRFAALDEARAV